MPHKAEAEFNPVQIVIAHLGMIVQAAEGKYKPEPGEIEKRQALIISYLRTGQCVASDVDRQLVQVIKEAMAEAPAA